jgi:hypothetical protein
MGRAVPHCRSCMGKDVKIISWSVKMVQKTRESGNLDSSMGRAVDGQSEDLLFESQSTWFFCVSYMYIIFYIVVPFDGFWPNFKSLPPANRLATKFAGVNIYGHPNISCEVQHMLTTKNVFYLELKRNRRFYRYLAEEITIYLMVPPMTNGKTLHYNYFQSHHTHYHFHFNTTSNKIYMTNKSGLWNISLIH